MPFAATWMNLEIIILREVRHTKKDKYRMISPICGIYKKMIQMNLFSKRNRSTDIENKLMVTKGERGKVRDKLGVWD